MKSRGFGRIMRADNLIRSIACVVILVGISSGWVYSYFCREKPRDKVQEVLEAKHLFHGKIIELGEGECLVQYPRFDPTSKNSWNNRMRFWFEPNTIVWDRRKGQKGTLAVGQRVSVWYHGLVLATDPGQVAADEVIIEPDE